jgi:hypothetical protein
MPDKIGSAPVRIELSNSGLARLVPNDFRCEESWIDRPVRIFHVAERNGGDRCFVAQGDENKHKLLRQLEGLGYHPTDMIAVHQDANIADFDWKRNYRWNSLPDISPPSFINRYAYATIFDALGETHSPEHTTISGLKGIVVTRATKVLVIAARDLTDKVLASFSRLTKGFVSLRVMHFDGMALNEVSQTALAEAEEIFKADARFVYNHAANMMVISSRAYLKIVRDEGRTQSYVESYAPVLDEMHWKLGHPLALQALFAIQRLGHPHPSLHLDKDFDRERLPWVMTRTLPFFDCDEHGVRFVWKGTGSYASWIVDLGDVAPGKVVDRRGVYVSPHRIFGILNSLYSAGYIGVYEDAVRITPRGSKFLKLIGEQANDPDVLVRWRSDQLLGKPSDVPAMDRWLNATFRAVKRNVAKLPASPIAEVVDVPWPPAASNELYVWGSRIDLSQIPASEQLVKLLDELDAYEASTDLPSRRFGMIREHIGFGQPSKRVGIWVGVPVVVTGSRHQKLAEVDLLKDWTLHSQMFEAAKALLPQWLNIGDAQGLIAAGKTTIPVSDINVPDKTEGFDRDFGGTKVFLGHVLVLPELEKCEVEVKRYAGCQSMARFFGTNTDGVWSFGYGNSVTFVYGILCGFQSPSGRTLIQKAICKDRLEHAEKLVEGVRKDWPKVFKSGALSEQKYWSVSPSGLVNAIDLSGVEDTGIVLI